MSKVTDLTIEVTAKTTIDRESAERCLKMVEWYCNDNNLVPHADRDHDGTLHFRFEIDIGRKGRRAYEAGREVEREKETDEAD